ncbi:MAG: DUF1729 domain-containing protein [Actinomycetaceae bacterium]|nr:DUF1729 domain-containing protein [Actinomycetaceae bacterium]
MSSSFLASLSQPYALVFAGQGSAWRAGLDQSLAMPQAGARIRAAYESARDLTHPIALPLLTHAPGAQARLDEIFAGDSVDDPRDREAGVSVPGITLAQLGALIDLDGTSLDVHTNAPRAFLGHSQGVLGAALAKAFVADDDAQMRRVIALSFLIGHAAQSVTLRLGANALATGTPMLSVRGVPEEYLETDTVHRAVINDTQAIVFSGKPADLEAFQQDVESRISGFNAGLEARRYGGRAINARFDFLPVGAPFHSPLLAQALSLIEDWVQQLNAAGAQIDQTWAVDIARAILVDQANWVSQLEAARDEGVKWFLDLGPSDMVTRMSRTLLSGTGTGMLNAGTREARTDLDTPGFEVDEPVSWDSFAPSLVTLPGGRTVVDTAFTRFTGRSPIVLPAMTPTTVYPEIVAAAANAGNWAEMAGGGQYSEEVFTENKDGLKKLLEPGRAAGFNGMFFDRYMWNLQFGVNRIVPKARHNGAPIDSVTIAAGIPEPDEADELITQLLADGFTYLCFKPGTVDQINAVLDIADAHSDITFIMQVEDGHAGGHHSWVNLDDLLLDTYARTRATSNVILVVGGGIGTPARATEYITGTWSAPYGRPAMPVDAVMLGTATMAVKEARTSPQVKQVLKDTPGVLDDGGWVGRGESKGGITSGLSHLDADMHEIENSSSRASRLIHELDGDLEAINARRDELIAALDKTAKPYFGDVHDMTYAEWITRMVDLSYPYADPTWQDRVYDLFHRIEGRLAEADHGDIDTLFPTMSDIDDAEAALAKLLDAYPQAQTLYVGASDSAWFVQLCRKYHKPMPFVPILDADLARWWGTDTLWQSHDERFAADAVRIIPGPLSVAGIDRIDEPIGDMFARYEAAVVDAIEAEPVPVYSRFRHAQSAQEFIRQTPNMEWNGNLVANPAYVMAESTSIRESEDGLTIRVHCDTAWDGLEQYRPHAVREIDIPILLPESCATGGYPVVDMARLGVTAYDLLAGAAGVGTTTVNGDTIETMPNVEPNDGFGVVHAGFTYTADLGPAHGAVTGGALAADLVDVVPDALVGPCWPAIYTALGTAIYDDIPVIEGLVNAVHLDHTVTLSGALPADGTHVKVQGECAELSESSSGRVVRVEITMFDGEREFARLTERFAIRGRVASTQPPAPAPSYAPNATVIDTPRSFLRRVTVQAPDDMTAFANVSGDFNPIHTSYAAAGLSGLQAPLVHGMWLSATAQHVISATNIAGVDSIGRLGVIRGVRTPAMEITGWSYQMYGMVDLNDQVEITVERVGRAVGGDLAIEVTCRIDDQMVSTGRALVTAPKTAYVYPGQGIQRAKMGMENMTPVVREIWTRADRHTRRCLGFSIEAIVRDNPTELRVGTEVLRHPEGVLNLTQFTQVALATLAYAQTQQLKADNAFVDGCMYAGHSLGEYNALAACADIFPLEQVLEIVYQRGSAMHHLVERDAQGRSNYRLGALRPNQFGVGDDEVREYIESVASASGEFLEIVNYNLAGLQYAVAGTIAGLEALEKDATRRAEEFGGRRPFMLIPGIDVPFHSSVLRAGVPAFREKLEALLPEELDYRVLEGRYVPNLVARPFELSEDFAREICSVVPSELVGELLEGGWEQAMNNPARVARTLLIELLAWQFASPVRWIETQDLLFTEAPTGAGVERVIEVGLASAPTLANLAEKTLALAHLRGVDVEVLNVERDEARVLAQDVHSAPSDPDTHEGTGSTGLAVGNADADTAKPVPMNSSEGTGSTQNEAETPAQTADPVPSVESAPVPAPAGEVSSAADAPDLPVSAGEAVRILLAYANKMTPAQVEDGDTVDTLTNGVSSKRNQLLMDMAAELGVPNIEGAAEATVSELIGKVNAVAGNYRAFGPVLTDAITARLRKLFGGAGLKPQHVDTRVSGTWGLGEGWIPQVGAAILLGTREGESVRGGELATLPLTVTNAAEADALIDAAVQSVASAHGLSISLASGSAGGGEVVDSAALTELKEQILGENGILASQARQILAKLGLHNRSGDHGSDDLSELVEAIDAELGTGWLSTVTPAFSANKAVLLDDRWASAREDLARIFSGQFRIEDVVVDQYRGGGESLRDLAQWYADHGGDDIFSDIAEAAMSEPSGEYANDVALVTGAAPNSIAAAVVGKLLGGGATVIMTASSVNDARLAFAKTLYRDHAALGASLWLVPANLSSFRDVDALIDWVGTEQTQTAGATTTVIKRALLPTLYLPFAAPPVRGTLGSAPQEALGQERLLLWSVERSIHQLSQLGTATATDHRVHVVLPGSPNRGTFGGDGAYGEAKAAFDAIVNKWSSEKDWTDRITLAHPRIGWVQGTGLMGANDVLVPAAEAAGVHVFTTEEMADELVELMNEEARKRAAQSPIDADLTGGLSEVDLDLPALAAQERARVAASETDTAEDTPRIPALPNLVKPRLAEPIDWTPGQTSLRDQVVIVGLGEISAWGSGRTRLEAEIGDDLELTAAGVMELAWMMGLIEWKDNPSTGWYDSDGNPVDEADIYQRYRDEVVARSGIRPLSDDSTIVDAGSDDAATVYLESDQVFAVDSQEDAHAYAVADPTHTEVWFDGEWKVLKRAGSAVRVSRRATLTRTVGGQIPDNFDPAQWGIPPTMLEALDRIAVWNLVTAVDAFVSAGFSPAELLQAVHPAEVSSTQGTGIGGMESLRKVFLDRFLGEDRPQDILQEALPNVVAAHTMQAYVGGYGQMIHPVGACATAAISVEEGVDKIRLGKSSFVVAGGIDDISVESLTGFGDMNATADSAAMYAKGISPRHFSRAGDRRRAGFLEAEGGGTVLLTRGDIAADLGLPVYGVVAYVQSFADGAHTSIPAPGIGALAAGRGGSDSALARALAGLGATPDDIGVLSKHDTSTNANDPNEAELHSRLCAALGRTPGNPLYVISQKTLTGHAKGGAALFQTAGICDVFTHQVIPPNRSLDCLDPEMKPHTPLVWLRHPLGTASSPIRAGVLTSLGFGHVSAIIVLVHPAAFEAALRAERGEEAASRWREQASQRLLDGRLRLERAMTGAEPLFTPIEGRRLPDERGIDSHEVEAAMLLDEHARLSDEGTYRP